MHESKHEAASATLVQSASVVQAVLAAITFSSRARAWSGFSAQTFASPDVVGFAVASSAPFVAGAAQADDMIASAMKQRWKVVELGRMTRSSHVLAALARPSCYSSRVMPQSTKLSSVLLLAAAVQLACRGEQPAATAENVAAAAETGAVAIAKDGAPAITADEAVYDFGAIDAADSIEHVFKIRNAGSADLKIERVQKT